jgi:hypothetical protein
MDASQIPAHMQPLDGAHLSAAQADLIMRMIANFRPFSDKDAAIASAIKDQIGAALDAFDAAHANA